MIKRPRPGKTLWRGRVMHGASPAEPPTTLPVMHGASPVRSGTLPDTDAPCITTPLVARDGRNTPLSMSLSHPLPYDR